MTLELCAVPAIVPSALPSTKDEFAVPENVPTAVPLKSLSLSTLARSDTTLVRTVEISVGVVGVDGVGVVIVHADMKYDLL